MYWTRCLFFGTEKTRKIHIGSHFIRNIGTHIADYLMGNFMFCFFFLLLFFCVFCSAYNGVHKFHFLCMHNNVNRVDERCEKFTFSLSHRTRSVLLLWNDEMNRERWGKASEVRKMKMKKKKKKTKMNQFNILTNGVWSCGAMLSVCIDLFSIINYIENN